MAFKHGVFVNEVPTSIVPTLTVASPTVVVGVAPLHLATNPAPPNTPILCNTFSDYVEQFGYSDDAGNFTTCKASYVHFILYNVRPVIFINVLDPSRHFKESTKTVTGLSSAVKIKCNAILSTLTVKSGETVLTKNTDYTAKYEDGVLVLTIKNRNKITGDSATLSYNEVDPSKVTTEDIIGGVDAETGKKTGIEATADVYPKYGVLCGSLIVPKYSMDSEVAAVMKSKVTNIGGCFNTIAICDIKTTLVKKYTDVYEHKNANGLVDKNLVCCWPMLTLGGEKYYMSTHVAALMCRVDSEEGDDVPFISPSNHTLQCDGMCLADGTEVLLAKDQADYLNSIGVVTGLQMSGWRLFGNYSSAYPSTTDSKDTFISVRRTLHHIGNTIILTFWSFVDQPLNRRLIEAVETSVQLYLNGLSASGALLGGTIQFLEEENQITDLIAGNIKFHLSCGFVVPAQCIEFDIEFDTSLYETLFS